jgi:hypothetical protein
VAEVAAESTSYPRQNRNRNRKLQRDLSEDSFQEVDAFEMDFPVDPGMDLETVVVVAETGPDMQAAVVERDPEKVGFRNDLRTREDPEVVWTLNMQIELIKITFSANSFTSGAEWVVVIAHIFMECVYF